MQKVTVDIRSNIKNGINSFLSKYYENWQCLENDVYKWRNEMMTKIRTRYAPSPTGRMHVGNLRSALYEFLIAKHEGGDFMLRIEDTDQERYVEGAVDIIYRTMARTGMIHDEGPDKDGGYGPYVQSERMKTGIYMKYAKELIEQEKRRDFQRRF